jgi:hypothetical protein
MAAVAPPRSSRTPRATSGRSGPSTAGRSPTAKRSSLSSGSRGTWRSSATSTPSAASITDTPTGSPHGFWRETPSHRDCGQGPLFSAWRCVDRVSTGVRERTRKTSRPRHSRHFRPSALSQPNSNTATFTGPRFTIASAGRGRPPTHTAGSGSTARFRTHCESDLTVLTTSRFPIRADSSGT